MRLKNQWLKSFFHAIILFFLSIWWTSTPWATQDETYVVRWSSRIRDVLFRKYPDPEKYLFVDVAHDKDTVKSASGMGVDVVTDREKLAEFFQKIDRRHPVYRFILCDISLTGKSAHDSALSRSVNGLKQIAVATHFDDEGTLEQVNFDLPKGITSAQQNEQGFFKFKLFQGKELRTLPVAMYEQISGHHLRQKGVFITDNDRLCFNTMIVDQRIRDYSVFQQHIYHVSRLSELLTLSNQELNEEWIKNRVVVIGDFQTDRHNTIFGQTAGALIILNIYLAMQKGSHIISWWWVIFMIGSLIIIAKITLYHVSVRSRDKIRWLGPLLKDTLLLSVFSVFSYLLFDRQVQILITLAYIYLAHFLILLRKKPITWQHFKSTVLKIKERITSA